MSHRLRSCLSYAGSLKRSTKQLKFFTTGRPEQRIKTGFHHLPLLMDSTDLFALGARSPPPPSMDNDIPTFLRHGLFELAQRRQLEGWPSEELIDVLRLRASGLFIRAVPTVKFLDSNSHLPQRRFDFVLKFSESSTPEGKTRLNSERSLDSYSSRQSSGRTSTRKTPKWIERYGLPRRLCCSTSRWSSHCSPVMKTHIDVLSSSTSQS